MKKQIHKELEKALDEEIPWSKYKKVFGSLAQKRMKEICFKYGLHTLCKKTKAPSAYDFANENKETFNSEALKYITINAWFNRVKIGQGLFKVCYMSYWFEEIYKRKLDRIEENRDKKVQERLRARFYKKK